jgi:putative membrane protein
MRIASLFTLAALGVAAAGLFAGEPRRGSGGDEKFSDKMFVEKAAIGGMFEVKVSQLAERMAGSTNVKQFAARMVTDHTKANQQLMALAQQKGWTVPTSLDQKHQELLDKLSKGEGGGSGAPSDQFDQAYMDLQVKAHEKTVVLFEKASQDCQDADLKAWAGKLLPELKQHEKLAQQIAGRGNPAGSTITTPPAGRVNPPGGTVPPGSTRPVPPAGTRPIPPR